MNVAVHIVMHAAAARAAAEQRIIRQLRDAGAASPRSAAGLDPSVDEGALESLLSAGLVVRVTAGRYFVNEEVVALRATARQRLQTRAILLLAALAGAAALLIFLGSLS